MTEVVRRIPGYEEGIPVKTIHNDVYPAIDPTTSYETQSLKGKVAFITGASSGIGQAIAIGLARAGASLAIAARRQSALDETREAALAVAPHAKILTFALDVRDTSAAADAVARTIEEFSRLDILIPNAGTSTPDTTNIHEMDPAGFWNTFEVNVKGVFNFVHAALPHLSKSHGRIISTGSEVAHWRIPTLTGYALSKMAVERFTEIITHGYPDVKAFVIHPGLIATKLTADNVSPAALDRELEKVDLPVALVIYLLEGKADWLNGRFFNAIWDIEEAEREWKDKVVEQNGLVLKLHTPN